MLELESVKVRVLPDGRVNRANAALILDKTPKTLAQWASMGIGPRVRKVGGRVFYDVEECLAMARGDKPIRPTSV